MRLQEGKLDFEIWIFFCQHPLVGVRLLSGGDDYRDDHDLHHDHDKNWPANWWASSPRSTQSFSTSAAGASTSTPSPQASTARFWNVKSQTLISGTKSSTADVSPKIHLFEKLGQHAVTEILKKMLFFKSICTSTRFSAALKSSKHFSHPAPSSLFVLQNDKWKLVCNVRGTVIEFP